MGVVYDALLEVSPDMTPDGELLGGYKVYESTLEAILTPEQLLTYAKSIRDSKMVTVFDEMTPDQMAALPPDLIEIATAILADENSLMENRRVASLLNQRGEQGTPQSFNA